jgi:hypothetical protein
MRLITWHINLVPYALIGRTGITRMLRFLGDEQWVLYQSALWYCLNELACVCKIYRWIMVVYIAKRSLLTLSYRFIALYNYHKLPSCLSVIFLASVYIDWSLSFNCCSHLASIVLSLWWAKELVSIITHQVFFVRGLTHAALGEGDRRQRITPISAYIHVHRI